MTQAVSRLLHCVSDPVWTRDVHGLAADAGMTLRYRDDGAPFKWVGWRVRENVAMISLEWRWKNRKTSLRVLSATSLRSTVTLPRRANSFRTQSNERTSWWTSLPAAH